MKTIRMFSILAFAGFSLIAFSGCGSDKPAGGDPKIKGDSKLNDLKPVGRSAGGPPAGGSKAAGGGAKATGSVDVK